MSNVIVYIFFFLLLISNSRPEDENETTPNQIPVKVPIIDKLTERKSDSACKLINALSASINLGLTPHIINGFPAEAGEFPHMAAIGYKNKLNEVTYDCGGSLISSKFRISVTMS